MLSKKLLDEIMDSQNIYDRHNIYDSSFSMNNGNFVKKDYLEIRTGLEKYIKETVNDNLGKKNIGVVM